MNRVPRKIATIGAAGLLALAGLGGIAGLKAHASGPPPVAQATHDTEPASQATTDPDQVQQEVQAGVKQDQGGTDPAETGGSAQPDNDTIQSQG